MEAQLKRLENLTNRLESVVNKLSSTTTSDQLPTGDDSVSNIERLPIIQDYAALISESVKPFVELSQKIGGDLVKMSEHVMNVFQAQQEFICKAIQSKKPANEQLPDAVKTQSTEIDAIMAFTSKNRKSPHFNHLSTISEGIPALSWIVVSPTPGPHIKDTSDAAKFYSNRILKEFKDKDPTHAEWVKLWVKVLDDLYGYVRKYHTTGLVWGSQGSNDFNSLSTPAKTPSAGGAPLPPPPPPPPPAALFDNSGSTTAGKDDSRNELMSSINALGDGVTSHLKKVPDSLKTHKNPELRQHTGEERDSKKIPPPVAPKPGKATSHQTTSTTKAVAPPKLVLEGNKWIVEHQKDKSEVRITDAQMRHSVYIYKCTNSTIIIEGKVNSVVLDQCTKVGLQLTSVVSLIEFINCKSMKAQVLERVPTIQIEKTDGCHIYLAKTSLDTEFITSKSSEMSINIPDADDEYKEYPIPEQFKTRMQNGKHLVTVPNESAGV